MESRAYALITGLFVLGIAGCIVLWAHWLAKTPLARTPYRVVSTLAVSGLNPEAHVRYRGMGVGRVSAIALDPKDPRRILVNIEVDDTVPVTKGTYAQLGMEGITGIAYVHLLDDYKDMTPAAKAPDGVVELPLRPAFFDAFEPGLGRHRIERDETVLRRGHRTGAQSRAALGELRVQWHSLEVGSDDGDRKRGRPRERYGTSIGSPDPLARGGDGGQVRVGARDAHERDTERPGGVDMRCRQCNRGKVEQVSTRRVRPERAIAGDGVREHLSHGERGWGRGGEQRVHPSEHLPRPTSQLFQPRYRAKRVNGRELRAPFHDLTNDRQRRVGFCGEQVGDRGEPLGKPGSFVEQPPSLEEVGEVEGNEVDTRPLQIVEGTCPRLGVAVLGGDLQRVGIGNP